MLTHLSATGKSLGKHASQVLCTFIFLPYEAFISSDAIARTLARMLWTKKNLLEWKTSSDANRGASTTLSGYLRSMWVALALSVTIALLVAMCNSAALLIAGPLLGLWLVSPVVAWWLSRTLDAPPVLLSAQRRTFLRKLGRRTWRYFEVFVNAEDNWLQIGRASCRERV